MSKFGAEIVNSLYLNSSLRRDGSEDKEQQQGQQRRRGLHLGGTVGLDLTNMKYEQNNTRLQTVQHRAASMNIKLQLETSVPKNHHYFRRNLTATIATMATSTPGPDTLII